MATIDLGVIKPVFKGAYNNSTAYILDNIVTSGGSSYICILASTGNAVSNATYWSSLATGGTDVGTTITTQGDVLFRDGSGLQRLAKGTAGQALVMNSGATAPEWGTGGQLLQTQWHEMGVATISAPDRANSYSNMAQVSNFSKTITTTKANSKIVINGFFGMRSTAHTHDYFDMKATPGSGSTVWLSQIHDGYSGNTDGLLANHTGDSNDATNTGISFVYEPNVAASTAIVFTYWVGRWGSGTIYWNEHGNANAHGQSTFIYQEVV